MQRHSSLNPLHNQSSNVTDEQRVNELLGSPIAFQRAFVELAGSVTAGLMLSQALHWTKVLSRTEPLRYGWFYKSAREWAEETGLTRREQETARKKLIKCGLLEEKLRGIPATLHFRVNLKLLSEQLAALPPTRVSAKLVAPKVQTGMAESAKPDCTEAPSKFGGKCQTISETTSETTSKNTHTPRTDARGTNREAPAARVCVTYSKFSFPELERYARNQPAIKNPQGWAFTAKRSGDFDELVEAWLAHLAQQERAAAERAAYHAPAREDWRETRATPAEISEILAGAIKRGAMAVGAQGRCAERGYDAATQAGQTNEAPAQA